MDDEIELGRTIKTPQ